MMAAAYYTEDMQILEEMRQLFPKIPDYIIQSCVSQCQGDKTNCCRLLKMYSPNSDANATGILYGSAQHYSQQAVGWQHKSPNSNRSQSYSGASNNRYQESLGKPQSAPVNHEMPFLQYGSYSPIGHFSKPPLQYQTPVMHHKSTLEIPPRYVSSVNMNVHGPPPSHRIPQLIVAVSTNGPTVSQFSHNLVNVNSPMEPRMSPRLQVSPKTGNSDDSFIQALLTYQAERYQQLHRELTDSKETLQKIKREISTLEESLQNRTAFGGQMTVTGGDALRSMRDEITKLRVECHCLSVEADICSKEQNQQGGDFYQNIFTGQVGPIPPVPPSDNNGNQIEDIEGSRWKCIRCTFNNHPALNTCEMCELPRKTIGTCPSFHVASVHSCYCHRMPNVV